MFRELILRKLKNNRTAYYTVLFPGVIIHETAHLLGCLITLTKVREVKFFSATGGFVVHDKPRIPIIGDFIISIAPLMLGLTLSYFLIDLIYIDNKIVFQLATIIYLYFLVSIITTMIPSSADITNSLPAYLAIIVLLVTFNKQIQVPYFDNIIMLLISLLSVSVLTYLLLSINRQKKIFKIK